MARIVVAVIAGFLSWLIAWFAGEKALSAIWPEAFGAHQLAFEAAVTHGGPFTADTTHLLMQVVHASVVSALSGFLAALIAAENKRAPLVLGLVLVGLGLLKALLSWSYVPIWYHLVFTALLLPMAILGGKLRAARS